MLFVATFHAEYIYDLKKKKEENQRIINKLAHQKNGQGGPQTNDKPLD